MSIKRKQSNKVVKECIIKNSNAELESLRSRFFETIMYDKSGITGKNIRKKFFML